MKRLLLALALLYSPLAAAQTPSVAQWGITHTTDPEVVYVLPASRVWTPIGTVDKTTNVFTPVAGGGGGGGDTNIAQWGGVAVGAMTNYGTAPSGLFPGVNAFITNVPHVIIDSGGGTFTWPGTATPTTYGVAPGGTVPAVNAFVTNPSTFTWPGSAALSNYGSAPSGTVPAVNAFVTNPPTLTWPGGAPPTAYGTAPSSGLFPATNAFVTNFPTTQSISAASLPLPAGAATSALQSSTQSPVGTPQSIANTMQGNAAGVPMPVSPGASTQWQVTQGTSPWVTTSTFTWPGTAGLTNYGTPPSGTVPAVNSFITGGAFQPTGNTLATPLTPGNGAVSSIAVPSGGISELVTNTGTGIGYVRLSVGSGTATANDIPIQPGSGCVLGLGSNTFINAFNTVAGSSINVASGIGLGNCPSGGGGGTGGGTGGNVNVVNVPPDVSSVGAAPLTAADAASTSTTGAGGLIWAGSPTAASAETFSLNTYQGAIISARGTFTATTTLVIEGTIDNAAAQIAGSAKWVAEPVVLPGKASSTSSFNAPFEQAGLTASGLQGLRCRIPSGQYTAADSITCTVRTTLTQPGGVLAGVSTTNPLQVTGGVLQGNVAPIWSASSATVQALTGLGPQVGKTITVTGMHCLVQGTDTNPGDCQLVQGTGTACATGQTALSQQFIFTPGNGAWPATLGPIFIAITGNGVCVKTTTVNPVVGGVVAIVQ